MLFSKSIIPIAGLAFPAMAARIDLGARQTSPALRLPAALLPPAPAPTEPPKKRWGSVSLFERDGDDVGTDTCGYIDDATPYPLTCGISWTCTNLGSYRGCCQEDGCTSSDNFYTECYDATATECSETSIGEGTLCCTYQTIYPYCLTYLWSTSAMPGRVFSQFNCDQSIFTGVYFLDAEAPTTTSSSRITRTTRITRTRSRTSESSSADNESTSEHPSATSVIVPRPTDNDNDSSSSSSSSSSGAPVGPIVGGVVGGVAAVAIAGFLIWFLMGRKKRDNNANVGPANNHDNNNNVQSPLMSQPGFQPPPGAEGQGSPGFDPRYSYVSSLGPAPSSPGNTTSSGYPTPYQNMANSMYGGQPSPEGQGFYKPPGSDVGGGVAYQPPQTNVMDYAAAQHGVPPQGHATEAPAVNPVGMGNNRAELA